MRLRIRELLAAEAVQQNCTINGWVRSLRVSKDVAFIVLNDGSNQSGIQVVAGRELADFQDICRITTGTAVRVEGDLLDSPATGQQWELAAKTIEIIGQTDESFPLQKKRHSFEYLRSIAHLRPRTNTFGAVFRLRSRLAQAIHRFFAEKNFLYVHTPIITASDCEGAGELFRVTTLDATAPPLANGQPDFSQDFFGQRTGLTVNLKEKCSPWHSATSTPLARPFGPRTPIPPDMPPNSG
jgi:asparaginyl-tRNA synthetase